MLTERLEALVRTLLADVELRGSELVGRGPDGSKWAVVWRGHRRGVWLCTGSAGVGGRSALSLVRDAACGGDHRKAFRWALQWLGEDTEPPPAPKPIPRQSAERDPFRPTVWHSAAPLDWEDPAGRYLVNRGVRPELLRLKVPGALRYHRTLYNAELRRPIPGMVAAIFDLATRRHIGLHRTYLADGPNGWRKAPVETPKMVLGSYQGGIVPLTRGATGRTWSQMRGGEMLLLAEGIENALIVAQLHPDWRSAAYIAANNLVRLRLPQEIEAVCLVRDRDGENWAVQEDREIAIGQWLEEGLTVTEWYPPEGVKDAADWWQLEGEEWHAQG